MKTIENLANALQAGEVRRYHTELVLIPQNVAQHSLNIQLILIWMYEGWPPTALMCAAVMHDMGERWTGDLPAPTKRADPEMKAKMDALEESAVMAYLNPVHMPSPSPSSAWALKFADCAEGALYCLREVKLGNRTLAHVLRNYLAYMEGLVLSGCKEPTLNLKAHQLMVHLTQEAS